MKGGRSGRASRERVTDWPAYLLTEIPAELRAAISADSARRELAVADVVREILCRRFRLHCPPDPSTYTPGRDKGARTLLLRMPPKLTNWLGRDSRAKRQSIRTTILEILEAHYKKGES